MRDRPKDAVEKYRVRDGEYASPAFADFGKFLVKRGGLTFCVICSGKPDAQNRWEHVSVSLPTRCPTWDEMCWFKDQFWTEDEVVIQYHVAVADHVNIHPHCLHLWRPADSELPMPPRIYV